MVAALAQVAVRGNAEAITAATARLEDGDAGVRRAAVAALAASRLTLMPINLLLAGMQKQLTPLASVWMHGMGARRTLRRLMLFSLALALLGRRVPSRSSLARAVA